MRSCRTHHRRRRHRPGAGQTGRRDGSRHRLRLKNSRSMLAAAAVLLSAAGFVRIRKRPAILGGCFSFFCGFRLKPRWFPASRGRLAHAGLGSRDCIERLGLGRLSFAEGILSLAKPAADVQVIVGRIPTGLHSPGSGSLNTADVRPLLPAHMRGQMDLELQRPDSQTFAGLQSPLGFDPLAVDVGAAAAGEVSYHHELFFDEDRGMVQADQFTSRPEVAVLRTADEELGAWNGHLLSGMFPSHANQCDFHCLFHLSSRPAANQELDFRA